MNSHGEDSEDVYCLLGRQEEDGCEVWPEQSSSGEVTMVDDGKLESTLKLSKDKRQHCQHSFQK